MAKRDIYSTMVLVFVCLALALVPDAHGMPTGVSADACDTLTPDYINPTTGARYLPQTGDTPYVLTVQPKSYTPGQVITVTVEGWSDFEGILLQARAQIANTPTPVGTWAPKDGYTLLTCFNMNDFLTHTDDSTKVPSVQFQWTAPSTPLGAVTFTATIAKNEETFWTPITAVVTNGVPAGSCSSSPCVNGVCFTGVSGSYFCSCNTGFTGTNCETRIVPICPNGIGCYEGTCFRAQFDENRYFCSCNNGYWGDNCNLKTTACQPTNPCKNGGTCFLSIGNNQNYVCVCATGYEPPNCEQPTVPDLPCDSNPCQNGGNCANTGNQYICTCSAGYQGTNCDVTIPSNPCSSNPCQNGGFCRMETMDTFVCVCLNGFGGDRCDRAVSCSVAPDYPCENLGQCTSEGVCVCRPGHSGDRCEVRACSIDPPNPCDNGGTCSDQGVCTCPAGYTGTRCEETIPTTCVEGTTCLNGGSCSAAQNKLCSCLPAYTGENCELPVTNHCEQAVCQNGGTCINRETRYSCACKDGYYGNTCATFTGSTAGPSVGLTLEIWWIALIALIGALLIIIIIVALCTILRSSNTEERHLVGDKRI
ncbi:uncharacterized protein [Asterias amurensis]|uniref:uncharacterized protein isoform X4 n=1 Tax=Asterias amurensis TaxID=7602 RepID=UPI003AB74BBC